MLRQLRSGYSLRCRWHPVSSWRRTSCGVPDVGGPMGRRWAEQFFLLGTWVGLVKTQQKGVYSWGGNFLSRFDWNPQPPSAAGGQVAGFPSQWENTASQAESPGGVLRTRATGAGRESRRASGQWSGGRAGVGGLSSMSLCGRQPEGQHADGAQRRHCC